MRIFYAIGVVLSVFLVSPAASEETTKEKFYRSLMESILERPIEYAGNDASYRKGDGNPYHDIEGNGHKALATCITWDYEALTINFSAWNAWVGRDWSNTEFRALKDCRANKRQNQYTCTCQVIDHDDENVLKVPADFLAKYEKKFSAASN